MTSLVSCSTTAPLKLALTVEAQAWKLAFGRSLNDHYRVSMENITVFVGEFHKKLSRPVNDLEDVRMMMIALEEIREKEIDIDMELSPIEVGCHRNWRLKDG